MPGKRVQFDQETCPRPARQRQHAGLPDEAFADLLHKHGRPVDLQTSLRQSVGAIEKRPGAPAALVHPQSPAL